MMKTYHDVPKLERLKWCVLGWRVSAEDTCPIPGDCRYWSVAQERCTFPERGREDRAALEAQAQ